MIDPAAAERQLRAAPGRRRGPRRLPRGVGGRRGLVDLCRGSGRLAEALALAEQMAGYTRQAGLGPWTQLPTRSSGCRC